MELGRTEGGIERGDEIIEGVERRDVDEME